MDHLDNDLDELVAKGKSQGYLTYDQVNDYLPDEAVNPDKLDSLLIALDELGIELVNEPPEPESYTSNERSGMPPSRAAASRSKHALAGDPRQAISPRPSDDPVRMYLTQMAEIPLLSRERGNRLAKKIEVTRKRFRRTVLGCNYAMQATIDTLAEVHEGSLPFDRTIKVSLTERLTKEQIMARMPHNLRTLDHLLDQNRAGLQQLISQQHRRGRSGRRPASGSAAAGARR